MKKRIFITVFVLVFALSGFASAECILNANLINQDPYPAIPGQPVKVVFQINGITNPQCNSVAVRFNERYPFTLGPGQEAEYVINSGIYKEDFKNFFLATYNLRVDSQASDGNQSVELLYSYNPGNNSVFLSNKFNVSIENVISDFEASVDSYSFTDNKLSILLLNVGKTDAKAVTVDLLDQDNVQAIGSKRFVVGDMDANQDDSANFNIMIGDTNNIKIKISYNDKTGIRRYINSDVAFDPKPFQIQDEANAQGGLSSGLTFIIGLLIPIVAWLAYFLYKKRKYHHKMHHHMIKK